jgi:ATP-binding cassette subfamily C (CFTR/MRP) protein 4
VHVESDNSSDWYAKITDEILLDSQVIRLIKTDVAMYIYSVIIVTAIVVTLLRSLAFFKMAMNASKNLHNQMFHALLQTSMRFFDTNPSGRVLNRFSKDMGAIDEFLPRVLMDAIQILLVMSGILLMVTVANYYMVVAIIVIGALFFKVRTWYVATAKDVKHLEGISKMNHFYFSTYLSRYVFSKVVCVFSFKFILKRNNYYQGFSGRGSFV